MAISWMVNYFRISKMKMFLKSIDEWLRTRIRIIIWKHWKKPKTQENNFVNCGYSRGEAKGLANCRRGYMFVAHFKILQNAISKTRLSIPNKRTKSVSLRSGLSFSLNFNLIN